ncbi:hypothetical protein SDRG_16900 [Saprolegnia diclina VS20]|uniref:Pentacotripeptide-repeat region of PRORP domain-containing protein n=1 Tax=Saprolegnia diclina (strain VS20) TaxID=1156394 RepID=T0PIM4_SAPDV|nr:hypothetical protein SDRG_16900 [Saprolegnia diclina VS20]EQC25229.1 hypothetical protein SDRG_16900 [Saprolegnia diclina VS20]|eukprot:XP_008621346.1 hypothetical protein SDRG_16900 [Saprolegnia diclina VS20]
MQTRVLRSALRHVAPLARSVAPLHRRALSLSAQASKAPALHQLQGEAAAFAAVEPPSIKAYCKIWRDADAVASAEMARLFHAQRYEDVIVAYVEMHPRKRCLDNAGLHALLGALNRLGRYDEVALYFRALKREYKAELWCEARRDVVLEGLYAYTMLKRGQKALNVLQHCVGRVHLDAHHFRNALACNATPPESKRHPWFLAPSIEHAVASAKLMTDHGYFVPPALWSQLIESCLMLERFDDASDLLMAYANASLILPLSTLVSTLLLPVRFHAPSLATKAALAYIAHPSLATALPSLFDSVLTPLLQNPETSFADVESLVQAMQAHGICMRPSILKPLYVPFLVRTLPADAFLAHVASVPNVLRVSDFVFGAAFYSYAQQKDASSCAHLIDYAIEHDMELTWKAVETMLKLHLEVRSLDAAYELAQLAFAGKSAQDVADAPRPVFRMVVETAITLGHYEDAVVFCDKYLPASGDELTATMRLVRDVAQRLVESDRSTA